MFFEDFSNPKFLGNGIKWVFPYIEDFYSSDNSYVSRLLAVDSNKVRKVSVDENTNNYFLDIIAETPEFMYNKKRVFNEATQKDELVIQNLQDRISIVLYDDANNETVLNLNEKQCSSAGSDFYKFSLQIPTKDYYKTYRVKVKCSINYLKIYGLS